MHVHLSFVYVHACVYVYTMDTCMCIEWLISAMLRLPAVVVNHFFCSFFFGGGESGREAAVG